MKIFIASDHAGFELKSKITSKFKNIIDLGPKEFIKEDDYPDYVYLLVKNLQKNIDESKGILICKNGGGVCIAANKFDNIRASISFSSDHTKSLVMDDNINILCIGSEFTDEMEVLKMVDTFLNTKFIAQDRHLRRIQKVFIIENSKI